MRSTRRAPADGRVPGEDLVELHARADQAVVREALELGPGQLVGAAVGDDPQAVVAGPALLRGDVHAHVDQGADRARGQAVAAHLVAGERRLLQQQHVAPGAGQPVRGGRARRSGPDDDDLGIVGVVGHRAPRGRGGIRADSRPGSGGPQTHARRARPPPARARDQGPEWAGPLREGMGGYPGGQWGTALAGGRQMTIAADRPTTSSDPWAGFDDGPWREAIDVAGVHPRQLHALRGRRLLPRRPDRAHRVAVAVRRRPDGRRARARHPRRGPAHPEHHHLARPGPDHAGHPRADRRPADRGPPQARDHAQRRLPDGRERAEGLRLRAGPARRGDLHQVPQDPQPGRLRRLHALDPRRALEPHHHRPARCLRPRPDHRRLPPRGPVRRRPADRGQEGRAGHAGRPPEQRRGHPRPRGAQRADPRAGRAGRARRHARPGPAPPGGHRPGGHPVAVHGLPRLDQGAERRGHEPGPGLDLPRRLPAARHRRRHAHRVSRPGAGRRLRHQAADGALPAHPRVRRAVLRRPDLGHRVDRRHGLRRPAAGDALLVPVPADPLQPGPGSRAEPHRPVVARRCPPASRSSAPRSPSTPRPSSTSPTTCCASSTRAATTARSPAACRACRSASGCSSSAPG